MVNNKLCIRPSDIPPGPHFVILVQNKTYVPGDERSLRNPGHGYPAHVVETWNYYAFEDEGEWKKQIGTMVTMRTSSSALFVAFAANPAIVRSKVVVEVN